MVKGSGKSAGMMVLVVVVLFIMAVGVSSHKSDMERFRDCCAECKYHCTDNGRNDYLTCEIQCNNDCDYLLHLHKNASASASSGSRNIPSTLLHVPEDYHYYYGFLDKSVIIASIILLLLIQA
ncbi:unnamed protein product [Linum trigynum]|uniref:Uncharacterized protein n=1 Tax=Linum trigynum TaxID=586398 RepID=A0AAV2EVZ0_9ROSI